MSIELSKGKRILLIIAIMLSNIAIMGEMVILPITYNLYDAFYESIGAVNFIVSGPVGLIIIFSLFASWLLKRISRKTLLVIGGAIFAVSTIFGAAIPTTTYMIITRIFCALGEGFVNVAAIALIADVYLDEEKRAYFMGIFNVVMAGVGAALSAVSGYLAVSGWQNAFNTYWSAVPMLIAMVLFIPSIKHVDEAELKTDKNAKKEPMGKQFAWFILSFIFFGLAYNSVSYFISVYVAEHALGNEAFSGMLSAFLTASSAVCCIFYGALYKKLKGKAHFPSLIALIIALALLYFFPSKAVACVSCILIGGAYGLFYTHAYTHSMSLVPESRIGDSVGVVTAAYGIGAFFVTYIITFLMKAMSTEAVTPTYIVFIALGVISALISFITGGKNKEV